MEELEQDVGDQESSVVPSADQDPKEPEEQEEEQPAEVLPYWVSTSRKRKEAVLHFMGLCHFYPGLNVKQFTIGVSPEELSWSSCYKICWRGAPQPGAANTAPIMAGRDQKILSEMPADKLEENSRSSSSSSESEEEDERI